MSQEAGVYIYVSENNSGQVKVLRMADSGALTEVQAVSLGGKVMPMAITPDRRHLFAAIRTEPFAIACFAINPRDGTLSPTGRIPVPESTVYLSTDPSGQFLLAAYNPLSEDRKTGLLTVHRIANGVAQLPPFLVRTPPKIHAIMADPTNRFVLAPSCDGDVIVRYDFDTLEGELSSDGLSPVLVQPKAGPRHLQFHPNGKFFYLCTEYDASVIVYKWSAAKGRLEESQTVSAVPPGHPVDPAWHGGWRGADMHFTPDGRWLYVSVRNTSTIAVFAVDPATGALTPTSHHATAREPRSFCIDPSGRYLFAAGFNEKALATFTIDAATGALTRMADFPMGDGPNWLECVTLS